MQITYKRKYVRRPVITKMSIFIWGVLLFSLNALSLMAVLVGLSDVGDFAFVFIVLNFLGVVLGIERIVSSVSIKRKLITVAVNPLLEE